jgi:hypothetical protein
MGHIGILPDQAKIRSWIYTVYHNKFAKISDFLRRSFLAGYQRKQEMKQDENEYLLNHRLWYKFNYDTNLYIVWILQKVYRMYKILNLVPRAFVWGRGERQESPGLGRSILHSDWLTPYCLKITELDSW